MNQLFFCTHLQSICYVLGSTDPYLYYWKVILVKWKCFLGCHLNVRIWTRQSWIWHKSSQWNSPSWSRIIIIKNTFIQYWRFFLPKATLVQGNYKSCGLPDTAGQTRWSEWFILAFILRNLKISRQTATASGREMVRQNKGVAASDLNCSESTYSPDEALTSPTATSNAAAFTFPFYLSSVISFKLSLFKLH